MYHRPLWVDPAKAGLGFHQGSKLPVVPRIFGKILLVAAFLTGLGLSPVSAATHTWNGGGTSGNWSTGANWAGGSAPDGDDDLVFAGGVRLANSNNLTAGTDQDSLTFGLGAGAFNLYGNLLDLDVGITNYSAAIQGIHSNISLDGTAHTIYGAAGQLIFNGVITEQDGTSLTITGDGSVTFAGNLGGPAAATDDIAVVKNGAGRTTFSAGNGYSGATTINAGYLRISHSGALGDTGSDTAVNAGGTLELTGNIGTSASEALSLTGQGVGDGGALLNVSGDNTFGGTITLQNIAGVVRISSAAGTLTLNAIGESGGNDKTLTIGGAGNVTINGVISGGADIALVKEGPGTLTLNGANTYTRGTTLKDGTLRLGQNNVIPNSGTFNFAGGILDANNATETFGALTLTADSTLNLLDDDVTSTLTFASASWTGGFLTINNWSGIEEVGSDDDAIIISTAPNQALLDHVLFQMDSGLYFATMSGNELVPSLTPVPEPTEWALILFAALAGFYKFVLRRFRKSAA